MLRIPNPRVHRARGRDGRAGHRELVPCSPWSATELARTCHRFAAVAVDPANPTLAAQALAQGCWNNACATAIAKSTPQATFGSPSRGPDPIAQGSSRIWTTTFAPRSPVSMHEPYRCVARGVRPLRSRSCCEAASIQSDATFRLSRFRVRLVWDERCPWVAARGTMQPDTCRAVAVAGHCRLGRFTTAPSRIVLIPFMIEAAPVACEIGPSMPSRRSRKRAPRCRDPQHDANTRLVQKSIVIRQNAQYSSASP